MKPTMLFPLRIVVVAFALAFATSARPAAEDVIKKTFEAAPGGQLVLDVDRGRADAIRQDDSAATYYHRPD